MNNPKEFIQEEFDAFVKKNNLEVFTKSQVDAFSKDVLEKSKRNELDEFETTCCAADYASLTPAIIRNADLSKSIVYYREAQREAVELPDGIFKSIDDRRQLRYRETSLNILKGIAGINCADDIAIEKAKALPLGTEKTYGGKLYVKTERGWRLKAKGNRGTAKQETDKGSKNEATSSSSSTKTPAGNGGGNDGGNKGSMESVRQKLKEQDRLEREYDESSSKLYEEFRPKDKELTKKYQNAIDKYGDDSDIADKIHDELIEHAKQYQKKKKELFEKYSEEKKKYAITSEEKKYKEVIDQENNTALKRKISDLTKKSKSEAKELGIPEEVVNKVIKREKGLLKTEDFHDSIFYKENLDNALNGKRILQLAKDYGYMK